MSDEEKLLKGLEQCMRKDRCLYETSKECPYRVDNLICRRYQMMADAWYTITELRKQVDGLAERLQRGREALCGPLDEDYCDYDCDIKEENE